MRFKIFPAEAQPQAAVVLVGQRRNIAGREYAARRRKGSKIVNIAVGRGNKAVNLIKAHAGGDIQPRMPVKGDKAILTAGKGNDYVLFRFDKGGYGVRFKLVCIKLRRLNGVKRQTEHLGFRKAAQNIPLFIAKAGDVPRIFARQIDDGVKQAGITAHYGRIGGYDLHLAGLPVCKVSPVLHEYFWRKAGVAVIVYAFNLHGFAALTLRGKKSGTPIEEGCASAVLFTARRIRWCGGRAECRGCLPLPLYT